MSDSENPMLEHSWFAGLILSSVLYGLLVWIVFQSVYFLIALPPRRGGRVQTFYVVYSLTIFAFMTADKACNLILADRMWIDHRNSEGGPLAYFAIHLQDWYNVFGSATAMFVNFLGDGLLLYRLYIIFNSTIPVMILPTMIYIASTTMAIVSAVQSGDTGGFLAKQTVSFAVPWIALTSAFNILVTALIAGRLLWARNQMRVVLGNEQTSVYTGVVAILVESALPFSIVGIIFAALLGKDNPVELVFTSVWGTLAAISPMLIILRVSMGYAWTRETMTQVSTGIDFHRRTEGTFGTETTAGNSSAYGHNASRPHYQKSRSDSEASEDKSQVV
ncbi:hypothetical protein K435DRAFT_852690 [Dendrothele bispora CBS 962.96]|uniref:G-protein coupled receptors family 1 profile domain-containing protein n=1 Tax=Dendrothele bispora (strain CBS 962.96) TaxID=1314807 RepID=A0A4V4HHG8_DENBC|nr:hypothetical protein K435DRAFT_852690 [Dendrothele bispora CBS 962.96]